MSKLKIPDHHVLVHDLVIIIFSILLAVVLVQTDALINILDSTRELKYIGSFIAGLFFTSVFTTALAIVTLGEIAQVHTLLGTALFGALGAVLGDFIILQFLRDRFAAHFMGLVPQGGPKRRLKSLFKLRLFRWFTFLLGGMILASPFPDEIGIGLMGMSKMRTSWFIGVSFVFNFIGIYLIGLVARAI